MSLSEFYQEIIIEHAKKPKNYGVLTTATYSQQGHNPLCGDQLTLYLEVEQEVIKNVRFEGSGCAISLAAASLMTEAIKGKKIKEAKKLFEEFHQMMLKGEITATMHTESLNVFANVSEYPMRVKCATLAWHTLKSLL